MYIFSIKRAAAAPILSSLLCTNDQGYNSFDTPPRARFSLLRYIPYYKSSYSRLQYCLPYAFNNETVCSREYPTGIDKGTSTVDQFVAHGESKKSAHWYPPLSIGKESMGHKRYFVNCDFLNLGI